jgi:hypothetical protein
MSIKRLQSIRGSGKRKPYQTHFKDYGFSLPPNEFPATSPVGSDILGYDVSKDNRSFYLGESSNGLTKLTDFVQVWRRSNLPYIPYPIVQVGALVIVYFNSSYKYAEYWRESTGAYLGTVQYTTGNSPLIVPNYNKDGFMINDYSYGTKTYSVVGEGFAQVGYAPYMPALFSVVPLSNGDFMVADYNRNVSRLKFDLSGTGFSVTWGSGKWTSSDYMRIDVNESLNKLYVWAGTNVYVFDLTTGSLITSFAVGIAPGVSYDFDRIKVDKKGYIHIISGATYKIYNPDYTLYFNGTFPSARVFRTDSNGNVVVAETKSAYRKLLHI